MGLSISFWKAESARRPGESIRWPVMAICPGVARLWETDWNISATHFMHSYHYTTKKVLARFSNRPCHFLEAFRLRVSPIIESNNWLGGPIAQIRGVFLAGERPMSLCVIRRVLWIALAVATLGQVARADEIDTFTVFEATFQGSIPGSIPGTWIPTPEVLWFIVGPFEVKEEKSFVSADAEFNTEIADIFELFGINPGLSKSGIHQAFFDCPPFPCDRRLYRLDYPTTLPLGIESFSTVAIPETPEPTATPEPATLGMLGSGLVMIAWRIRRKASRSSLSAGGAP